MNSPPGTARPLRAFAATLALSLAASLPFSARAANTDAEKPSLPVVPYVSTPQHIVDRMLKIAKVGKDDVVYDLGCGDGRIVITAAKQYGARGVGIDLNPARIEEAEENRKAAGVGDRVKFRVGDLFQADFSAASVVTLYLLPEVNQALRPILWSQLKVGTRIVSHAYDMGPEWPAERHETVGGIDLYYWTIKPEHKRRRSAAPDQRGDKRG